MAWEAAEAEARAAAEAVWSAAEAAAFPEIRDAILAEIMRPA
jgi:hypothetical protein